jgi:hypothetical protein
MEKYVGIIHQLGCVVGIIITTLTINNPVWDRLGIISDNPAEKKYTAKGFYRRNISIPDIRRDIL